MEKDINHFCHEHPLTFTKSEETICYGCRNPVVSGSAAYVCNQQYCPSKPVLHKRCAEIPTQILHSSHPQHPLHLFYCQQKGGSMWTCGLCNGTLDGMLGYRCPSCNFGFDISCQQLGCVDLLEKKRLQHPSHCHPLTLMRKPAFLFFCDGCGTEGQDMAYICSACEFWIHKTCASLPNILPSNHHHHLLSLAFNFPIEHSEFVYECDVCLKGFYMTCWVYYCGDCRYFAHVKCATSSEATKEKPNLSIEVNDGSDLIQLPVHDISKELITPFVIRENCFDKIPSTKDMPASVTMPETTSSFSFLFNYHKHPLSLVHEGAADDEMMMMMICDLCITPIYSPPYYNCATCKYFVHMACYLLPKTFCLDSQPYCDCLPTRQNHKLTMACTSSELDNRYSAFCQLCKIASIGMVYGCEDCKLTIDVKCASLPTTIKHASHPQHKLIMKRRIPEEVHRLCDGCGLKLSRDSNIVAYYCTSDDCGFALGLDCILLPQSVKHEWDKHPLLLTYDASKDHPTEFYCEVCEQLMHPKKWMYHCRECDHSFHGYCLTASGHHRNIKYGRQVEFDHRLHPHPLTFNQVTLKLRCDICHQYWYKYAGFECASCNYVMCFSCGFTELGKM